MAGDTVDLGVVDAIGRELVVRAEQLEHGGAAEDQIRFIRGVCRRDQPKRRKGRQSQPESGRERAPGLRQLVILAGGFDWHETLRW